MSRYIKSFSNASDMRSYLDTTTGMKYYLLKNESGVSGVGSTPESGKMIVSLYKGRDYLTFTAQQSNSTVKHNSIYNRTAEYSLDNGTTWIDATNITITLANVGDKVIYRGVISGEGQYGPKFTMTGKIAASGSIMSMFNNNPNDITFNVVSAFKEMFAGCTSLTQAPELPATTLANFCYQDMFNACTSLTQAPELPATTLSSSCYQSMFKNCTSLTQAPELPATTLANYCYQDMFRGCTSLTQAPELPATALTQYCYASMFDTCTSLVIAPIMLATNVYNYSCASMFENCTSLEQAPELLMTNMSNYCYQSMFKNCSSLKYIKIHNTSWTTSYANTWLEGVSPSGTVECPTSCTIPNDSTSGIPSGWTRVNY